jgi:pseudouridine-5'-phosphate glycosidase
VIAGEPVVGLSEEELEILATSNEIIKVSRRDLAPAVSLKKTGARRQWERRKRRDSARGHP